MAKYSRAEDLLQQICSLPQGSCLDCLDLDLDIAPDILEYAVIFWALSPMFQARRALDCCALPNFFAKQAVDRESTRIMSSRGSSHIVGHTKAGKGDVQSYIRVNLEIVSNITSRLLPSLLLVFIPAVPSFHTTFAASVARRTRTWIHEGPAAHTVSSAKQPDRVYTGQLLQISRLYTARVDHVGFNLDIDGHVTAGTNPVTMPFISLQHHWWILIIPPVFEANGVTVTADLYSRLSA